ncbi:bis(5'-nucleosyl)-tetraphosphatase (symmetrical) YqeK [Clostridium sp. SHJSY1]|uniref:bis(5'-nucleosyl)-tetraphosphatase (symmetrical) YqeK n=1 Tax=Clostridium sp. SHJSY1 TaxID=2942483 RepID=UPI00287634F4|nr:bis(5'-nucleosyl)-tetraphosphatase (symmetrical) YqeK [Clostridium sp. SHJSY1]MDS0528389.1 bis(5'-nucleosyl)-tetraphosphatase (symmetrical) YqeK [Clostridium sp. SHJSY1]
MSTIEEAYNYVKSNLKETRFVHTLGVVSVSKKLAKLNEVSEEKAELAALCHDIAKNLEIEKLKEIIIENRVELTEDEKRAPELWHSIVGPIVARNLLKVDDEEILSAMRWHTTGKENMTKLEKIVYIADMIEPSRSYEGVEYLREETVKDLDKGMLLGLTSTMKFLLSKGKPIDLNTVKARNYLISSN